MGQGQEAPALAHGAAFEKQIALHEPMARALAQGKRGEFERAAVEHQRALLGHLGLDLPDWDRGI